MKKNIQQNSTLLMILAVYMQLSTVYKHQSLQLLSQSRQISFCLSNPNCEGDAIDKVTTTRCSKKYELIRSNPPGAVVILSYTGFTSNKYMRSLPGAVVILRDQAEELPSHQSQPYTLLRRLLHNQRMQV